jgi:glycosyltransferase involved in cell wall biosynthesis
MTRIEPAGERLGTASDAHSLSVVVPLYNERENVAPLIAAVHEALTGIGLRWELILVDDGSRDGSYRLARDEAAKYGPHVRVLGLRRNFGQTAAIQAGIDAARGTITVLMDGDLQNDPKDVPLMVRRLLDEDLDMVSGWRKDRKDSFIRRLPSVLANGLIRRATGLSLHDSGCSLKVYRSDLLRDVRLYGEMHRFIPAWIAMRTSHDRIGEQVVTHHPRRAGASKYGIGRSSRVLLDLVAIVFFLKYAARPGHFFGLLGLGFGVIGGAILAYLLYTKIMGGSIASRPLFTMGILFAVMSVQFILTGVQSEMIARIYYSNSGSSYVLRPAEGGPADGTLAAADADGGRSHDPSWSV